MLKPSKPPGTNRAHSYSRTPRRFQTPITDSLILHTHRASLTRNRWTNEPVGVIHLSLSTTKSRAVRVDKTIQKRKGNPHSKRQRKRRMHAKASFECLTKEGRQTHLHRHTQGCANVARHTKGRRVLKTVISNSRVIASTYGPTQTVKKKGTRRIADQVTGLLCLFVQR